MENPASTELVGQWEERDKEEEVIERLIAIILLLYLRDFKKKCWKDKTLKFWWYQMNLLYLIKYRKY